MQQDLIKFTPIVVLFFIISIIFYISSSYYKTIQANNLIESRENNKLFSIKLGKNLKDKAGSIVSRNNFDPIIPNTLLRILLQSKSGEFISYLYDKNLIITTKNSENIIDIRDIVDYLAIDKNSNKYTIFLD